MNINGDANQKNNNDIIYYLNDCYRLKNLATQYKSKAQILFEELVKNAKSIQYSSGGEKMHRGYYCPSPTFDLVVGKCNRGKLLDSNVNKKVSFEYYFDSQKRLVAVIQPSIYSELIIYIDSRSLGLSFDKDKCLNTITECNYKNGTIQAYTRCFYNCYTDDIASYEKEAYTYKDDLLQATEAYVFLPDTHLLNHEKYTFEHDDMNYLKTYKVTEYINGEEKQDSLWKFQVFEIAKKRKAIIKDWP